LSPPLPEGESTPAIDLPRLVEERKQWTEKAARLQDQVLRLQSDIEHIRKRFQREREDTRAQITAELLGMFVPVLDHFDLALKAVHTALDTQAVVEGISMIQRELDGVLQSLGLEKMTDLGMPFDPNLHEAVAVESCPEQADQAILEVLRPGWRYRERCLRATMVKVNRLASGAAPTPKPTPPPEPASPASPTPCPE
jgi:molecular chaperone GrpE